MDILDYLWNQYGLIVYWIIPEMNMDWMNTGFSWNEYGLNGYWIILEMNMNGMRMNYAWNEYVYYGRLLDLFQTCTYMD